MGDAERRCSDSRLSSGRNGVTRRKPLDRRELKRTTQQEQREGSQKRGSIFFSPAGGLATSQDAHQSHSRKWKRREEGLKKRTQQREGDKTPTGEQTIHGKEGRETREWKKKEGKLRTIKAKMYSRGQDTQNK